jgi:hypothetical protein
VVSPSIYKDKYRHNTSTDFYCSLPSAVNRTSGGKYKIGIKSVYIPRRTKMVPVIHICAQQMGPTPLTYYGDSRGLDSICTLTLQNKNSIAYNFDTVIYYTVESGLSTVHLTLYDDTLDTFPIGDVDPVIVFSVRD